jgi:ATP phosphoribosyltransferase regulatory subunit HisZ
LAGVDAAQYAQTHLLHHIYKDDAFQTDLEVALKSAHASLDKALSTKVQLPLGPIGLLDALRSPC